MIVNFEREANAMRVQMKQKAKGWAIAAATVLALNVVWLASGSKVSLLVAIAVIAVASIILLIDRAK